MRVWAIADLHLAVSTPDKKMDVFGPRWENYMEKIRQNWLHVVGKDDLVLIAGDISWAKKLDKATLDLEWIESLPGTKVMIKGNHDYWWESVGKVRQKLGPSTHVIQNDAFHWGDFSIGGARLWDTPEYRFWGEKPLTAEDERIFERELQRLEMSLMALKKDAPYKIAMTHYPPVGPLLAPSRASHLFEKYGVHTCVFGHLHNINPPFGAARGVNYYLTSSDALEFKPLNLF